jgi:T5SS/PEP-CTERM-associated repeat protein
VRAAVAILIGALSLSIAPAARSQYSANFQDTIISGVTSNWSGDYIIGSNTFADILFVQNNGVLVDGNGYLGYEASGSNNVAAVIDSGSVWSNGGSLYIGSSGANNFLWIAAGGAVVASNSFVGYTGTNNETLVSGQGSVWSSSGDLTVGWYGSSNTVTITSGGAVYDNTGCVGCESSSEDTFGGNAALVTGTGSVWSNRNGLSVGYENFSGVGINAGNTLTISDGGAVYSGGGEVTGPSSVVVTGNGSVWSNSGELGFMNGFSENALTIADGGAVYSGSGRVAAFALVTGSGSVWSNTSELVLNGSDEDGTFGSLSISNGGAVYSASGEISGEDGSEVLVTGTGSVWSVENDLYVDSLDMSAALTIADGGAVYCGSSELSVGGALGALVTGAGSVWRIENGLDIISDSALFITNGGAVYSDSGGLGNRVEVLVTGTGSVWRIANGLNVAAPKNFLVITDGGAVFAANAVCSGDGSRFGYGLNISGGMLCVTNGLGTGVLQVDGDTLSISDGTVTADQFVLSDDDGVSTFSFASGLLTSGGTYVTNGQNFVVGDGTDAATFHVVGGFHSFADGLMVSSNALVTGCGTIDGSVIVDPGGTALANCGGSLTFTGIVINNGTLRAISGSVLEFYGPVVNNGLIDITGGTTNFHSTFINNGSIIGASPAFQITGIVQQANNILITWATSPGQTNELQVTAGGPGGSYSSNDFTAIFAVTNTLGSVTNYLDIGGATNTPSRYYRVRLVP